MIKDDAGQVLKVHLVADSHPWGNNAELLEGALGPLQKGVALDIAVIFDGHVLVVTGSRTGVLQDH